jgi:ankyrin repeat protein
VQYGSLGTVDFLLTRGADPNQRDGSGMPPICWAAIHNRLDAAKTLVEQGAEVELPDIDHYGNPKKKSIDYALSEGYDELADYLQSRSEQAVDGNSH